MAPPDGGIRPISHANEKAQSLESLQCGQRGLFGDVQPVGDGSMRVRLVILNGSNAVISSGCWVTGILMAYYPFHTTRT